MPAEICAALTTADDGTSPLAAEPALESAMRYTSAEDLDRASVPVVERRPA